MDVSKRQICWRTRSDESQVEIADIQLIIFIIEKEKMSSINAKEMELKCTTKWDIYKIFAITGEIYLPLMNQINWDFIRDLLSGDKLGSPSPSPLKYIEGNRVKIIDVPHIDKLYVTDLPQFASNYWNIRRYIPEYKCEKYLSRKWIWNISKFLTV